MQDASLFTTDPAMLKQTPFAAMKPRPDEAKMVLGRRKEPSPYSDTSCMIAWMDDLVWLEGSRSLLPMSIGWSGGFGQKKVRFGIQIRDILEPRQKDMMQP